MNQPGYWTLVLKNARGHHREITPVELPGGTDVEVIDAARRYASEHLSYLKRFKPEHFREAFAGHSQWLVVLVVHSYDRTNAIKSVPGWWLRHCADMHVQRIKERVEWATGGKATVTNLGDFLNDIGLL